jgi:HAD superfamily hydrolase (TIGR01459 family)
MAEARAVICTGLFHENTETPDDYAGLLAGMKAKGLAMICANPDKIVRKGNRVVHCAGALAEAYAAMGGEVLMAGKPFAPIYDLALRKAAEAAGRALTRDDILAIGDGPETDIGGAAAYGLAAVLVADGITDARLGLDALADEVRRLVPGARLVATVRDLGWGGSET